MLTALTSTIAMKQRLASAMKTRSKAASARSTNPSAVANGDDAEAGVTGAGSGARRGRLSGGVDCLHEPLWQVAALVELGVELRHLFDEASAVDVVNEGDALRLHPFDHLAGL